MQYSSNIPCLRSTFLASSNSVYYSADLPYSTNESSLQQQFSNFGQIAEGKCHFRSLVCFKLFAALHWFHYATVFTISGSETSQEWSHKQVKRLCIYSIYLSRRCHACPRDYG